MCHHRIRAYELTMTRINPVDWVGSNIGQAPLRPTRIYSRPSNERSVIHIYSDAITTRTSPYFDAHAEKGDKLLDGLNTWKYLIHKTTIQQVDARQGNSQRSCGTIPHLVLLHDLGRRGYQPKNPDTAHRDSGGGRDNVAIANVRHSYDEIEPKWLRTELEF